MHFRPKKLTIPDFVCVCVTSNEKNVWILFHEMDVKRTHLATQQVHVATRIIGFQQNSIVICVQIMEF